MVVSGVGSAATTPTLSDSPHSDLEFAIFTIKVLHRCVLLGGGGGVVVTLADSFLMH